MSTQRRAAARLENTIGGAAIGGLIGAVLGGGIGAFGCGVLGGIIGDESRPR